mmetsp:Transcript_49372/g.97275  ORF Transcript_49372/g.97275 Transcript_49372/m.97275 type:complete len:221 (-) Transcript_49372:132-794(-)
MRGNFGKVCACLLAPQLGWEGHRLWGQEGGIEESLRLFHSARRRSLLLPINFELTVSACLPFPCRLSRLVSSLPGFDLGPSTSPSGFLLLKSFPLKPIGPVTRGSEDSSHPSIHQPLLTQQALGTNSAGLLTVEPLNQLGLTVGKGGSMSGGKLGSLLSFLQHLFFAPPFLPPSVSRPCVFVSFFFRPRDRPVESDAAVPLERVHGVFSAFQLLACMERK